jgi:outer membrane protein
MFRRLLLAVLSLTLIASATPARADMAIAVVDMQQVLTDSLAAKSILAQLKTHRDGMDKNIKALEDQLKTEEGTLIKKKETAKPEEFSTLRQAFEKKLSDSRAKVQKDRNAADAGFNKAINELRQDLVEIVSALATEKKIQLVITKQNVIIGDTSLDITKDVMAKLDAKVKSIKVVIEK